MKLRSALKVIKNTDRIKAPKWMKKERSVPIVGDPGYGRKTEGLAGRHKKAFNTGALRVKPSGHKTKTVMEADRIRKKAAHRNYLKGKNP